MDGLVRKRSLRLALLALIVLASFAGIFVLRDIFTPLILGFLIAYVLDPFADGLEACRLPRLAAVVVIFLIFTSVLVVGVTVGGIYTARGIEVAVMRTVGETKLEEFPENAPPEPGVHFEDDAPKNGKFDPGYFVRFKEELADFKQARLPEFLAAGIDEYLAAKKKEIEETDRKAEVVERLRAIESWVEAQLSFTVSGEDERPRRSDSDDDSEDETKDSGLGLFTFISYTVFLPIYVFFFLLEIDTIIATIRRHLPSEHRETVVRIFGKIDRILAAFFRGRLTVCLVKGVLTSIGLLLFGVPLAIPIGLAAGFLSLLPYVGIYLTLVPAMLLSWFDAGSLGTLIGIVAFYGAIEALEGLVLIPKLLGREVGLHPLTIIVTLLVFGKLFGLVGVLLSVPLAAIAKILADEFVMPLIRDLADLDEPEPESS